MNKTLHNDRVLLFFLRKKPLYSNFNARKGSAIMNFTWVSNLCNDFWLVQAPRAAAAVFIIFNLVAMQLYPGGTIHNPHSANYHLTQNFFSDLEENCSREVVKVTREIIKFSEICYNFV